MAKKGKKNSNVNTNNKKVNNNKVNNNKSNIKKTNNQKKSEKVKSRVARNKSLYENDLTITRQQQFDFGDLDLTSTLDTSFIEGREKKQKIKKSSNTLDDVLVLKDVHEKKKSSIGIICLLILIIIGLGSFLTYHYTSFNHNKKDIVKKIVDDNYLFLGDSITDFYDLDKYYGDLPVVNSGIGGNITNDILDHMNERVYRYNPSKVFLLIGTNDIQRGTSEEKIVSNIEKIIEKIQKTRPYAKIYLESIYPVVNDSRGAQDRKNSVIISINKKLKKYCEENKITYINFFDKLKDVDDDGNLKEEYTVDGIHLSDEGYKVVTKEIKKYLKEK